LTGKENTMTGYDIAILFKMALTAYCIFWLAREAYRHLA